MTLRAVAEAAKVSIKTASRALTGEGYVSAETRQKVLTAARHVGYVPNRAARGMRSGDAQFVGLLAHFVTTSPFTTDIIRGVQGAVEAAGRALLISEFGSDGTGRGMRLFREFNADPVLLATSYHMSAEGIFDQGDRRVVLINCFVDRADVAAFVPDDEGGGYLQARYLIELGHRRVGVIELPEGMIATGLRRAGRLRAFAEAGLAHAPDRVRAGQAGDSAHRRMVAFEAALDLLGRPNRPTALICSKDEYGLQAMGAAARLGLRVPDDLSIIGFDDLQVLAATMRPALTTVRLPYLEMGRLAAETALRHDDEPRGITLVPCAVVERDSTRAL